MIKQINKLFIVALLLFSIGFAKNATSQYCTPTYTNGAVFGIFIMKVQLDSISDSTGAMASPYYSYDSTKRTSLKRLQTYTINITAGNYNGNANNAAVFIDYNGDQDYADAGEKIGQISPIGAGPTVYSITFTVPCNAVLGNTRIRVRMAAANNNIANMDPCNNYGWGECQDYRVQILDNPLHVTAVDVAQNNTLNVVKGSTNQELLKLKITTDGCSSILPLSDVVLNTNGSSDTNDINSVQLYYTGNSSVLGVTNSFNSSSLTNQITLSGTQQLVYGDNNFWLTYDIKSGANQGNVVDGIIDSVIINNQTFIPSNNNPNGNRMIDTAMTFQGFNLAQNDTTPVVKGSQTNEMMMIEVVMSNAGGSVPVTSFDFNTTGSTNATNDITLAKVYYSGANNYFDTTILFGSKANPNGAFAVSGLASLSPGSNYFWVTYDAKATATTDDTVDIQLTNIDINAISHSHNAATQGLRTISNDYCYPVHAACGTSFIQAMSFAGINNTSSGCTNISGNAFYKYPASFYTTAVNKGNNYKMLAYNSNANQTMSVWIDYNHSGTFDNTEYTSLTKNASANIAANDTASATIAIPCAAKNGWTKMRIRSRGQGGANGANDACTQFGSGETEEYYIFITNQTISYIEASQASTANVLKGWTNQQILKMAVVANSCGGNVALTNLNFNTNGTTDTADIKAAKVYYTGASKTFATTTLLGSVTKPGANFAITCNQTLVTDTNWIWLVYDIDTNATLGNYVDAELKNLTIGGNSYTPITTAPAGSRQISGYMTLNSTTVDHPIVTSVVSGSTSQAILRIKFNMTTGASAALTNLYLNTKGTKAPTTNIANAIVWSTGANNTFTSPTQFGTTVTAPNGAFAMTGNYALSTGDNYLWLTYNIQGTSVANDTVDAVLDSFVINSISGIPANGAPAGYRLIVKTYCIPVHQNSCAASPSYINGVKFNTINNQKSGCTSLTTNKYNVYPAATYTTTVNKGTSYYLVIQNDTNSVAQAFGAWLDINQNGTFETTEYYSVNTNLAINRSDSVLIQIPCTAQKGQTRLRIRSRQVGGQLTSADACTTFGSGETEDYTINIKDNPNTGWLGKDKVMCNNSNVLINSTFNFVSYLWSTGDTTTSITVNTPGTYYLTAKTLGGCIGTDTINIIGSTVSVNLGNDTSVCNGGSVVINAGTGYSSYKWSNGDTTQSSTLSNAGNYTVTVKNVDGCTATDTIQLTYNYASVSLGNDTSICVGASINLNAGAHTSYTWNTGDTTQSILVKQAGKFKVQVMDAGGCSGADSINVYISNPSLNLGNDTSICSGKTLTIDAGNWATYSWNNGINTQTNQVSTAGNYIANVKDIYGCATSDTIQLSIDALPVVNLGNDTTLCNGNNLVLNGGNGNQWNWSNGDTTQSITVGTAGLVTIMTANAKGCIAYDSVKVTTSTATVSAGPDKSHCEGLVDTLFATTNGIASYQWSNGATTWFIIPQVGGNYWVKVTNALGCTAVDTAVLTVLPVTSAAFTVAGANNPYTFTPTDTNGANYLWDFGDGSLSTKKTPTYTYQAYGNFTVSLKVTSTNGCVDSKTSALIYNSISSVEAAHLQLSAYPNPFAEELTVSYTLLKPSTVSMMVYDITGKQVYTAIDRKLMQGNITQTVDLAGVSNGLYLVKLTIDGQVYTLKATKNKN